MAGQEGRSPTPERSMQEHFDTRRLGLPGVTLLHAVQTWQWPNFLHLGRARQKVELTVIPCTPRLERASPPSQRTDAQAEQ